MVLFNLTCYGVSLSSKTNLPSFATILYTINKRPAFISYPYIAHSLKKKDTFYKRSCYIKMYVCSPSEDRLESLAAIKVVALCNKM